MSEPADLAVVVQKAYEFNLWMLPHAEKFPRTYRLSLGQNLVEGSLGLLMNLVDATYQGRNAAPLAAAMRDIKYCPLSGPAFEGSPCARSEIL